MALNDFFAEINDVVKIILDSSFEIEIYDTKTVPRFDDNLITWDNLDENKKKCKRLESCVLYIDIRNSAALNVDKQAWTLARLYSAFVRSMVKAAKYHGGHVRNIIGDRVMVVFDQDKCFTSAVNTAILMNSIAKYIIDRNYSSEFNCGIGIDYGKMLITKAGEMRRGSETEFYRSLVWLGRPANIASRLTDLANKSITINAPMICEGHYYASLDEWGWYDHTYDYFLDQLETTNSQILKHEDEHFKTFFKSSRSYTRSYPPILMTEAVLKGFQLESPQDNSIKENWWAEKSADIKEYNGKVFGGDVIFTQVRDI